MSLFVKEVTCENEFPDIVSVICVNGSGVIDELDYVPERTCKNVAIHPGYAFECSECWFYQDEPNDYGNNVTFSEWEHCPKCGAKVVEK